MEQISRNAPKPLCISAAAERAHARAPASAGQTPGRFSATYSTIASESHTVRSPSRRHGTLPLGEPPSLFAVKFAPKTCSRSWNGMPSSVSRIQGRSDHEE